MICLIFLGDPQMETKSEIRVKVVNKAMPVFDRAFYKLQLSENTTVGTSLLTTVAKSNIGGIVAYTIINGDPESLFDVEYMNGKQLEMLKILFSFV